MEQKVIETIERDPKVYERIQEVKKEIKRLAEIQKKQKGWLRTPHHLIKEKFGEYSSVLQFETFKRAGKLTRLHIEYNQLRGKPWDMHMCKN